VEERTRGAKPRLLSRILPPLKVPQPNIPEFPPAILDRLLAGQGIVAEVWLECGLSTKSGATAVAT